MHVEEMADRRSRPRLRPLKRRRIGEGLSTVRKEGLTMTDTLRKSRILDAGRTLAFLAGSFSLAFMLQVVVHELGHYGAGMLAGARGGTVFLHPFYTSRVVFASDPGLAGQVLVGIAGIILDVVVATTLTVLLWKKRSQLALPFLAWGAIAYFGEGLGMIGSLSLYAGSQGARVYDDVTNMFRIGAPSIAIWAVAIVFAVVGLVMMALIVPAAGVGPKDSIWKRLASYAAFVPLYFGVAVMYIRAFSPTLDNLEVRTQQLIMGSAAALLLAALHRPIQRVAGLVVKPRPVLQPRWSDVGVVFSAGAVAFTALIAYSALM